MSHDGKVAMSFDNMTVKEYLVWYFADKKAKPKIYSLKFEEVKMYDLEKAAGNLTVSSSN